MSENITDSALALREAVLDHDTWNEGMSEIAGITHEGFITIDGERISRDDLPAATLARLGLLPTDDIDDSVFDVAFGRKVSGRYGTLSNYFDITSAEQEWVPDDIYEDHGPDAAFVRVSRLNGKVALSAYYFISATESFEPDQPPLCDVRLELKDHMPFRQFVIELGEMGGSLVDVARAIGIDPLTNESSSIVATPSSLTDLRAAVAEQLGNPLTAQEINESMQDEEIADEMQAAELVLQPLGNEELFALASLAKRMKTSEQC